MTTTKNALAWLEKQVAAGCGAVTLGITEDGDIGLFRGEEEKTIGRGTTVEEAVLDAAAKEQPTKEPPDQELPDEPPPDIEHWIPDQRRVQAGTIWRLLMKLQLQLGADKWIDVGTINHLLFIEWNIPEGRGSEAIQHSSWKNGQRILQALANRALIEHHPNPNGTGWRLTIHGWMTSLEIVFGLSGFDALTIELVRRLDELPVKDSFLKAGEANRRAYDNKTRGM